MLGWYCRIGLGFNEYGQTSCQQKCEPMAVLRGHHSIRSRPRKVAAIQISSMPNEEARVRMCGSDAHKAASLKINSLSTKQAGATTEVRFPLESFKLQLSH